MLEMLEKKNFLHKAPFFHDAAWNWETGKDVQSTLVVSKSE